MTSMIVDSELERCLEESFGHGAFRPGQRGVIEALISGRSALAVFPTGGGKSLCYQLPAVIEGGLSVVISPLLALMKDQVDQLNRRGIPATRLDSDQTEAEVATIFEDLMRDRYRLLYLSPERFCDSQVMDFLRIRQVQLLAIDEAHCISEWGHQFRPDYLKLAHLTRSLGIPKVLALTATATPQVMNEIGEGFGISADMWFRAPLYRSNLQLLVELCPAEQRHERLLAAVETNAPGATIVYVTRRETAEYLATYLMKKGQLAKAYHAGLPSEQRIHVQESFMKGEVQIVVATIAFGMGIDKEDVRSIYHYNLPKSIESYVQESGRAGRDGKPARCHLFANGDDVVVLENFIYGDVPSERSLLVLMDYLLRQGEVFEVSPFELASTFDIRPQAVDVLIALLEVKEIVERQGMFRQHARFQFLRPLRTVMAEAGKESGTMESLLEFCDKWNSWYRIDLVRASEELQQPREQLDTLLTDWELAGDIRISRWGVKRVYRRRDISDKDRRDVRKQVADFFLERTKKDLARIDRVLDFVSTSQCLAQYLSQYFGESMEEPCGQCSTCLVSHHGEYVLPDSPLPEFSEEIRIQMRALRREKHPALKTSHQLARFLCGISSPAATRARLNQREAFGLLQRLPFQRVLAELEEII